MAERLPERNPPCSIKRNMAPAGSYVYVLGEKDGQAQFIIKAAIYSGQLHYLKMYELMKAMHTWLL